MLSAQAPDRIAVTAAARWIRPGELVVLTITTTEPAAALRVRAFNTDDFPFPVDSRTWRVLVGIDLATAPGTYRVDVDAGSGPAAVRATHTLRREGARISDAENRGGRRIRQSSAWSHRPHSAGGPDAREALAVRPRRQGCREGRFSPSGADPANSAFGARSIFDGQPRQPHETPTFSAPRARR